MGATSTSVILMLSKGYITLMFIAALIATPLAYSFFEFALLKNNYYRIEIGLFEILVSLSIMFGLGLGTILSQVLKASRANPVDTLRYE